MEEQSEPDEEELISSAKPGEVQCFVGDQEDIDEAEGSHEFFPLGPK